MAKSSVPRLQAAVHNLQQDPDGFCALGVCLQHSTAQPRSMLAPIRSSHRPKTWSTPVNYSWGVCRNIQLSIHHFLKSPRVLTDQQEAPNSFCTLAPSRGCPCIPLQLGGSSSGAAAPRLPSAALQWLRSQRSGAM